MIGFEKGCCEGSSRYLPSRAGKRVFPTILVRRIQPKATAFRYDMRTNSFRTSEARLAMTPLEAIASLEALQKVIDVVASPIFVKDREHRWVLVNDAMCKFMGLPRERLIGKSDFDTVPAEQAEIFWTIDDRVFDDGEENENEEEHTDLNGNVRTIVTHKRLVHVGDGIPLLVGVITDITEFREAEAHSRYLALHDGLSGLANRILLNDKVEKELA